MTALLLTSLRPWGGAPADLLIEDGVITALGTDLPAPDGARRVDARGLLALPGLLNTHAHVDKSWWGKPWVSYGGEATTQGRIAHERAERGALGIPSEDSTVRVMEEFLRHGTTATRTHVDVDLGVGLDGIASVRAAAERLGGALEVRIVAFPQDGVLRRPGVLDLLDRAAAEGADAIGGLDPAGIDRDPVGQLDALVDIAERRGAELDIHLHDGGSLGVFQLELLIERTVRAGLQGRVNVSHGFALHDVTGSQAEELLAALGEAGISWTSVAPLNRGRVPWRAMRAHGVGLGLGTDGIRDLWSPYGDGDMLRIALNFAQIQGLRHDEEIASALHLITRDSARFVGRDQHNLAPGSRGDVVLVDAENLPDALLRAPRRELVVAGGRIVAEAGELVGR
ncbi:amidohydrolase [Brachybacterium saurashtrense]|uniref:Cytosine deaminase n=1 Tax=Brachybacterium saurashtrense TaxID=556288 RepID=A0A345YRL5_9MICO|nr:amidohydrolase [Brachybacterium saurashtrense]AXK46567.1 cytosine deaminase [Brachybacterium saurashtrense]RRR24308.1 cytosine deaminase [Brachybacterium saurashtrense]